MTLVKLESLTPESLVAIKERQAELKYLVKENSFIECTQETYDEAKRRRTALRKGRTNVQNEVKMICSKLAGVSRGVKDAGDQLIMIVQKAEDKQQYSVGAFEEEKERIQQEKIRLEQERKDKLKEEIISWMGGMNDRIGQAQTSKDLEKLKNKILQVQVSEEAKQEFPSDIAWAKTQLELSFNNRVTNIELEEQRAEKNKLRKENEALEKKAEKEKLEREKIELKQKAEQKKIQQEIDKTGREKKELEQKLKESEQANQELEQKLNGTETEDQPEPPHAKVGQLISPDPEPIQENQEEELPNAELIKVWNLRSIPDGNRYGVVKDPNIILAYIEEMERGNELYIECDEITIEEFEALKEVVI